MNANGFLDFLNTLINGFLTASEWLNTPLNFLGISITPLHLVTFGGLVTFLTVAIVKWVAS